MLHRFGESYRLFSFVLQSSPSALNDRMRSPGASSSGFNHVSVLVYDHDVEIGLSPRWNTSVTLDDLVYTARSWSRRCTPRRPRRVGVVPTSAYPSSRALVVRMLRRLGRGRSRLSQLLLHRCALRAAASRFSGRPAGTRRWRRRARIGDPRSDVSHPSLLRRRHPSIIRLSNLIPDVMHLIAPPCRYPPFP